MARVLVIDNYDSFVWNLVQYLGQLGADPIVVRNDAIDLDAVASVAPDGILLSPGPGRPADAGISLELVRSRAGSVPILGVCLGHQVIGEAFGGDVVRAGLMHGKTSAVHHDGLGIFAGVPAPFEASRYHSLVVAAGTVPPVLQVSAWTDDGLVMGLRHRELDIEGVQFHPESVLSAHGHRMLATWLGRCGQVGVEAALAATVTG